MEKKEFKKSEIVSLLKNKKQEIIKEEKVNKEKNKIINLMKFLGNDKNYNRSFDRGTLNKVLSEGEEKEPTSDENLDNLLLGQDTVNEEDDLVSNEYYVIAKDFEGRSYVDAIQADSKEDVQNKIPENIIIKSVIIMDGSEVDDLLENLYMLRGGVEEGNIEKPPFFEDETIIDESKKSLRLMSEFPKLTKSLQKEGLDNETIVKLLETYKNK